jgi:hypothetical protein
LLAYARVIVQRTRAIELTHQAHGANDHVVEMLRRLLLLLLLLPEQVPEHRPRSLPSVFFVVSATGVTVTPPPVVVEDALAELSPCLGDAGEPPSRPPEVQHPENRQGVVPVRRASGREPGLRHLPEPSHLVPR